MNRSTPIAIIGMAALFPEAKDLQEFWANILAKRNCIREVPPTHWQVSDYYDPDPSVPDKSYSKMGGFLPYIDFNPLEWGIPPSTLELIDTSQLLSLIVARDAMEDAGYGASREFNRDAVGVVCGVCGGQQLLRPLESRLQYPVVEKILKASGVSDEDVKIVSDKFRKAFVPWKEDSFPGLLGNVIAGRIANRLNLGGQNCVLDSACASSMSAVRMAVNELQLGYSDMMIMGGVDADNSIGMYMNFSKTPAFTPDATIRPFDIDANGMMVGEGVGMVVLKRLEDAERDNDRIYAVIRGIGSSSDGKSKSVYAPRPDGQAKALRRAYDDAGFEPSTVGLVEAHGTGTKAGDVAEFAALKDVFGDVSATQHIALGSVKSQIGHTKAAAGIAGFIKAALALHHKVLPATINITEPNPKLHIGESAFYLNTENRPWIRAQQAVPRRAGISAFGFGGTNYHCVLEEYDRGDDDRCRLGLVPQSIILSADNPEMLLKTCRDVARDLEADDAQSHYETLIESSRSCTIPQEHARIGFVATDLADAKELLRLAIISLDVNAKRDPQVESWDIPQGVYYRSTGQDFRGKTVALFSGQGSQYVNMGRELAMNFPPVMNSFARMDGLFIEDNLLPLSQTVYPTPVFTDEQKKAQKHALQRTECAQPAIGALSVGLYNVLKRAGFMPDFVAGHSFGEVTALWAAGSLSDEDYFRLAKARGYAMKAPDDPAFDAGGMLAVMGAVEGVHKELDQFSRVTIANMNSCEQVVLAGATEELARVEEHLKAKNYSVVSLPVSAAFHTSFVKHAQMPFSKAIDTVSFDRPTTALYSNTTGGRYPDDVAEIKKLISQHILNPVRFKEEIENIYEDGGRVFIEFGPRDVLTKLVKNILKGKPHAAIALNASPKEGSDIQLRRAVVNLRVAGLDLEEIDPYQRAFSCSDAQRTNALGIKLCGTNYVSDETRDAYENALHDGHRIASIGSSNSIENSEAHRNDSGEDMRGDIEAFCRHQEEILKVHERFLDTPKEYAQIFAKLMQQQMEIVAKNPSFQFPESLSKSMEEFHKHLQDTIRVHEKFIESQSEQLKCVLGTPGTASEEVRPVRDEAFTKEVSVQQCATAVTKAEPVPCVAPQPTVQPVVQDVVRMPEAAQPAANMENVTQAMLEVVSEKTGYPTDMLELGMDMEADLGIDSIKRVEILGAMQERIPDLPQLNAEDLSELRTLSEIVDYMKSRMGVNVSPSVTPPSAPTAAKQAEPFTEQASKPSADIGMITQAMLEVVSEKTGYPAEMLELGMDMEADLGIDSIKRVEILGAMQERISDLPQLNAEDLSELRTLSEIVDYMNSRMGISDATPAIKPLYTATEKDTPIVETTAVIEPVVQRVARLTTLPLPDYLYFSPRQGNVCVLTDDGTPTTAKLAQQLLNEKWKVAVLRLPKGMVSTYADLPSKVSCYTLNDCGEDDIRDALDAIKHKQGPVAGFIHLHPQSDDAGTHLSFSETDKQILKSVFFMAKYLKKSLNYEAIRERAFFMTVARLNGRLGYCEGDAAPESFSVVQGGVFGLTKTLSHEWDRVFCRAIDLGQDLDSVESAQRIVSELHDPDKTIVEVGYSPEGRTTLVAQEVCNALDEAVVHKPDSSSVFVVSGGGRGITARCVERLARECRCKFILLGRTDIASPEPAWAQGCSDDGTLKKRVADELTARGEKTTPAQIGKQLNSIYARREIEHTLDTIRAAGAEAEYVCADVVDAKALKGKLMPVFDRWGTPTGIIHGAGVLADKLIEKKTERDFESVFATKIAGLESLLACVDAHSLQHLVIFSSAAGFYGNSGQSDYAIANEVLNKTAHLFKKLYPACHVTAFDWGPWEGGMVTPELKRAFEQRNIRVIPIDEGTRIFADGVCTSSPGSSQIIVGSAMHREASGIDEKLKVYRVARRVTPEANPFLRDHAIGGNPVMPMAFVPSWMGKVCEGLYPGYTLFKCSDLKVLKGIVFDTTSTDTYTLTITETNKTSDEIDCEVTISSDTKRCRERKNYSGRLKLVRNVPQPPVYTNYDLSQSESSDGKTYYTDGTLFHGPAFQGVEKVNNTSLERLTVECGSLTANDNDLGQFGRSSYNPFMADLQLQSFLIWVRQHYDAASLPLAEGDSEWYRSVPEGEKCYITLEITSHSSAKAVANIITHDKDGTVYMRKNGAEVTLSKNMSLL